MARKPNEAIDTICASVSKSVQHSATKQNITYDYGRAIKYVVFRFIAKRFGRRHIGLVLRQINRDGYLSSQYFSFAFNFNLSPMPHASRAASTFICGYLKLVNKSIQAQRTPLLLEINKLVCIHTTSSIHLGKEHRIDGLIKSGSSELVGRITSRPEQHCLPYFYL